MDPRAHLPLIALAAVSALAILYLYRELQKARRALVAGTEDCSGALCEPRKRGPAEGTDGRSSERSARSPAREGSRPAAAAAAAPKPKAEAQTQPEPEPEAETEAQTQTEPEGPRPTLGLRRRA